MRFVLLLVLSLFSCISFAANFVWTVNHNGSFVSTSPDGACSSANLASGDFSYAGAVYVRPTEYNCTVKNSKTGAVSIVAQAERSGSGCAAGSNLNDATGLCVPVQNDGDKCSDQTGARGPDDPMIYDSKAGKCVLFTDSNPPATCKYIATSHASGPGAAYQVKGVWDAGVPSAPPTFAQDGLDCEVATVSSSDCVTDVKGNITCNVIGKMTGNVSNKAPVVDVKNALCPDGPCTPVDQTTSATNDPCVYSGSASSQTCTSDQETQTDGKQSCGTVNGSLTCVYSKPSSNGIQIATTLTTDTAADGSKTSTKTDTATTTKCTDVNKCTSSTSVTTTKTTSNGAGQTTGVSTNCKGSCVNSGNGGTGTGSTSPTGTGSGGSGDGTGQGGDGIGLTAPKQGSFDDQADDWDKKIDQAKKDFKDGIDKVKGAFKPVSDINLSGGGQLFCPPAVTVMGQSISFCMTQYAGSLSWIGSAIYALCAMVALVIVFV